MLNHFLCKSRTKRARARACVYGGEGVSSAVYLTPKLSISLSEEPNESFGELLNSELAKVT